MDFQRARTSNERGLPTSAVVERGMHSEMRSRHLRLIPVKLSPYRDFCSCVHFDSNFTQEQNQKEIGWGKSFEPRVHPDRGLVRRRSRAAGQILLATTKKILDEKTPRRSSLPSLSRKPRAPASAPGSQAKSSHEKEGDQVAQAHRCGRRTATRQLERGRTEGRVAGGGSRRNVGWAQVGGEQVGGEQVGREQLGGEEQVGWGGDSLAYWERGPVWGWRQVNKMFQVSGYVVSSRRWLCMSDLRAFGFDAQSVMSDLHSAISGHAHSLDRIIQ